MGGRFLDVTQGLFVRASVAKNSPEYYQTCNNLNRIGGVPLICCEAIIERWGKPGFGAGHKALLTYYLLKLQDDKTDKDCYMTLLASSVCSDFEESYEAIYVCFKNSPNTNEKNLNNFFLDVFCY